MCHGFASGVALETVASLVTQHELASHLIVWDSLTN